MVKVSLSKPQFWVWVGAGMVAATVAVYLLFPFKPATPEPDFQWNSQVTEVGVDSSGLRIAYRYTLDLDSYNPLYVSTPAGCTVLGSASPHVLNENVDEHQYTESYLKHLSDDSQPEEVMLNYNNSFEVPFLRVRYVTDSGEYVTVYGRLFNHSGVFITATLTCNNETLRSEQENAVEDGFRVSLYESKV